MTDGVISLATLVNTFPADFNSKGCLSTGRKPKGRPYLIHDNGQNYFGVQGGCIILMGQDMAEHLDPGCLEPSTKTTPWVWVQSGPWTSTSAYIKHESYIEAKIPRET
jgi:hypothetical protein